MLMRFDPFRELDRLTTQTFRAPSMPMDAYRRGHEFFVHFDLPGIDADSLDLTIEKNVVTVKAERAWPREQGDDVVVAERPQGTFSRQLFLGDNLDAEQLRASYDNGVLTLTIPVAEKAKPRRVEVSSSGTNGQKTIEASSTEAEAKAS